MDYIKSQLICKKYVYSLVDYYPYTDKTFFNFIEKVYSSNDTLEIVASSVVDLYKDEIIFFYPSITNFDFIVPIPHESKKFNYLNQKICEYFSKLTRVKLINDYFEYYNIPKVDIRDEYLKNNNIDIKISKKYISSNVVFFDFCCSSGTIFNSISSKIDYNKSSVIFISYGIRFNSNKLEQSKIINKEVKNSLSDEYLKKINQDNDEGYVVKIYGLFGKRDVVVDLRNKINIVIGENGYGKSIAAKIAILALSNDNANDKKLLKYYFNNLEVFKYEKKYKYELVDLLQSYETNNTINKIDLIGLKVKTKYYQYGTIVSEFDTKCEILFDDLSTDVIKKEDFFFVRIDDNGKEILECLVSLVDSYNSLLYEFFIEKGSFISFDENTRWIKELSWYDYDDGTKLFELYNPIISNIKLKNKNYLSEKFLYNIIKKYYQNSITLFYNYNFNPSDMVGIFPVFNVNLTILDLLKYKSNLTNQEYKNMDYQKYVNMAKAYYDNNEIKSIKIVKTKEKSILYSEILKEYIGNIFENNDNCLLKKFFETINEEETANIVRKTLANDISLKMDYVNLRFKYGLDFNFDEINSSLNNFNTNNNLDLNDKNYVYNNIVYFNCTHSRYLTQELIREAYIFDDYCYENDYFFDHFHDYEDIEPYYDQVYEDYINELYENYDHYSQRLMDSYDPEDYDDSYYYDSYEDYLFEYDFSNFYEDNDIYNEYEDYEKYTNQKDNEDYEKYTNQKDNEDSQVSENINVEGDAKTLFKIPVATGIRHDISDLNDIDLKMLFLILSLEYDYKNFNLNIDDDIIRNSKEIIFNINHNSTINESNEDITYPTGYGEHVNISYFQNDNIAVNEVLRQYNNAIWRDKNLYNCIQRLISYDFESIDDNFLFSIEENKVPFLKKFIKDIDALDITNKSKDYDFLFAYDLYAYEFKCSKLFDDVFKNNIKKIFINIIEEEYEYLSFGVYAILSETDYTYISRRVNELMINGLVSYNDYIFVIGLHSLLSEYKKILDNKKIILLEKTINKYFVNKYVKVYATNIVVKDYENNFIPINMLSTGEKNLIIIVLLVLFCDSSILLLDEPDLSMSVDWQSKLLVDLLKLSSKKLYIISQSPLLIQNNNLSQYISVMDLTSKYENDTDYTFEKSIKFEESSKSFKRYFVGE